MILISNVAHILKDFFFLINTNMPEREHTQNKCNITVHELCLKLRVTANFVKLFKIEGKFCVFFFTSWSQMFTVHFLLPLALPTAALKLSSYGFYIIKEESQHKNMLFPFLGTVSSAMMSSLLLQPEEREEFIFTVN